MADTEKTITNISTDGEGNRLSVTRSWTVSGEGTPGPRNVDEARLHCAGEQAARELSPNELSKLEGDIRDEIDAYLGQEPGGKLSVLTSDTRYTHNGAPDWSGSVNYAINALPSPLGEACDPSPARVSDASEVVQPDVPDVRDNGSRIIS